MRALTEGRRELLAGWPRHFGSLDTSRCSDMLKLPEKAESARDFGLSTRWWMQPRRRRLGMQRTHLADPSGIRIAFDPVLPGSLGARQQLSCARDQRLLDDGLGKSAARNSIESGNPESACGQRKPYREYLQRRDEPGDEACSGDGMSLADLITQMVPRLEVGPLNREGARR